MELLFVEKPVIGECVAVLSDKYDKRTLLGRITAGLDGRNIQWYMKEWKGRHEGKTVIYSDSISLDKVLCHGQSIAFSNGKRLNCC